MICNWRTDDENLDRICGLYVGQLDAEELELFERAVSQGCAIRSYEGGAGFMGLAKVKRVMIPKQMDEARKCHSQNES